MSLYAPARSATTKARKWRRTATASGVARTPARYRCTLDADIPTRLASNSAPRTSCSAGHSVVGTGDSPSASCTSSSTPERCAGSTPAPRRSSGRKRRQMSARSSPVPKQRIAESSRQVILRGSRPIASARIKAVIAFDAIRGSSNGCRTDSIWTFDIVRILSAGYDPIKSILSRSRGKQPFVLLPQPVLLHLAHAVAGQRLDINHVLGLLEAG